MSNILIDPIIAMTPPTNTDKDEVEEWFGNLNLWLTEALSSPFTWLYAKKSIKDLLYNSRFPDPDTLFRWQRTFHLDVNIRDINSKIGQFFNGENKNDLGFRLEQMGYLLVAEPGSIAIVPNQFVARWPDFIHIYMHELLATTCACKYNGESLGHEMHIATLTLGNAINEIKVAATVLEVLPDFSLPDDKKIAQTFPLLFTRDALPTLSNVVECWDEGEKGICYAISQQYKKYWAGSVSVPMEFHLGPCFVESVNERGLDTNEIVLRKIINRATMIIAGQEDDPMLNKEPLEESKGNYRKSKRGTGKQRIRAEDQAKAWRVRIEERHAGWRLQYWKIPTLEGSIIEFANVGKEDERGIC